MENPQTSVKKSIWKTGNWSLRFGTSPEVDWKIILISTMALTILVVALCVYMFIKIDKGEIFVVENLEEEEEEKALDVSVLKETVLYYQNKALELENIKSSAIPAPDPSL